MRRKMYIVISLITAFLIIAGIMLSIKMNNKNTQNTEIIGTAEEIQEESTVQALETEPQVPETWDLNKVYPVLSEDNIYVPVPNGWSISSDENERYVNRNIFREKRNFDKYRMVIRWRISLETKYDRWNMAKWKL